MEGFLAQILGGASGAGAYALVLLVLLACGLGVPLPEDVALITGGFLVFKGAARLEIMLIVAFVGILGGDSFAFFLGRKFGDQLEKRWPFRLFVTPARRKKVEGLFAKYGQKVVVVARFMPGVRAVTYFLAGGAGMRYPVFIAFDGLAALVSAPVFVLLGYHFGARIDWLLHALRSGQKAVVGLVAAAFGVWLLYRYVRKRLAERQPVEVPELPAPPPPQRAGEQTPSTRASLPSSQEAAERTAD